MSNVKITHTKQNQFFTDGFYILVIYTNIQYIYYICSYYKVVHISFFLRLLFVVLMYFKF